MSEDGYYGDFESLADEQRAFQKWCERQQEREHEVVPCLKCGTPMYQESDIPSENLCSDCLNNH